MDPHLAFVAAAYGLSALVVASMIAWILLDHRNLSRAISELEDKGVRRRSAGERQG